MKGIFIVIEGIDGAGKGYVMMRLQEYIMGRSKKYDNLLLTREPTNKVEGQKLREMLANESDPLANARKTLEFFVADRKKHLEEDILPALEKGYVVLCDRYKHSTMAFQTAQGLPMQECIDANKDFPAPDLVILLDLPSKQALWRIHERDGRRRDKFENEQFMEKVRQNYLEIAKTSADKFAIIDASKDKSVVFARVQKAVEKSGIMPY